jgi:peroxiredoxin
VHVVEKYYTRPNVSWLDSTAFYKITTKARTMKPLLLGKKAPPLVLTDTIGNYISLNNLKSKYTVLLFWDPDCGHCIKEVPKIAAAYDSIKALKGEVFAVMGTPEADKWKKFIRDNKLKWINVGDPYYHNNFREVYDLKSYPQLYILDENKEIIARKLAAEQIVDFLQRYEELEKRRKAGN